jgi:hypothetical protein
MIAVIWLSRAVGIVRGRVHLKILEGQTINRGLDTDWPEVEPAATAVPGPARHFAVAVSTIRTELQATTYVNNALVGVLPWVA